MKKGIIRFLLATVAASPALAFSAANDLFINQRTSDNQSTITRTVTAPSGGQSGLVGYNGSLPTQFHAGSPVVYTLGPGLTLTGSVLDVVSGSVTWSSISGKPNFSTVATTGQYSDLLGRPTLFSGAYADLTGKPTLFSGLYADLGGVPSTFAPSPHTHAASDIVSGVLADARIPSIPISKTTGLQPALDAKLSTPTGTTSQYLRGDGTIAAFPAIPAAQVQVDWNATSGIASISNKPALAPVATAGTYSSLTGIPSTFPPSAHSQAWSTITATPTTLSGYGISDGVSQSALTAALGSYATNSALTAGLATKFNVPTGTTAQYVRGDGSLATLPAARRIETYSGTTNASGQITVMYPTAYPVAPVVQPPAPALANQVWTTVASTTTGFTMQLSQRNTVTLLAVEVLLGATVPVNGAAATFLVVAQ